MQFHSIILLPIIIWSFKTTTYIVFLLLLIKSIHIITPNNPMPRSNCSNSKYSIKPIEFQWQYQIPIVSNITTQPPHNNNNIIKNKQFRQTFNGHFFVDFRKLPAPSDAHHFLSERAVDKIYYRTFNKITSDLAAQLQNELNF